MLYTNDRLLEITKYRKHEKQSTEQTGVAYLDSDYWWDAIDWLITNVTNARKKESLDKKDEAQEKLRLIQEGMKHIGKAKDRDCTLGALVRQVLDPTSAKEEKNYDGYGLCPKCHQYGHPETTRERRPNGDTICGHCGVKTPSREWVPF